MGVHSKLILAFLYVGRKLNAAGGERRVQNKAEWEGSQFELRFPMRETFSRAKKMESISKVKGMCIINIIPSTFMFKTSLLITGKDFRGGQLFFKEENSFITYYISLKLCHLPALLNRLSEKHTNPSVL